MLTNAYDALIGGIYYDFSNGEAAVTYKDTHYGSYSGSVVIPGSVNYKGKTYSVTSIGKLAFYKSNLTSVTLPNCVTSIGEGAFEKCSSLSSITIPESVTSIGDFAFNYCSDLTYIAIPNSVTSIGNYAFSGCSSLTSVDIPNSVTSINPSAFSGCTSLTSVTIPNSVTSIGFGAFYGCSGLTSITIGSSVASIGSRAFYHCSRLKKVIVPDIAAWCSISFTTTHPYGDTNFLDDSNPLSIAQHLFRDEETEITDLVIPNGVTSIGFGAFSGCSSLTSVTIPNSVASIGSGAFSSCSGLTSILIPNSVSSIDYAAFYGCSGLSSVILKSNAFISARRDPEKSMLSIFGNQVKTYILGEDVKSVGDYAFCTCRGLTSVTIGNNVTGIGSGAFYGCSSLTSILIPNSVTSIGSSAFRDCISLSSITIPNSISSIGYYAFYGTAWYEYQPDGLVYAGSVAYKYKGTMPTGTHIIIKEGTLGIADDAFLLCNGLTSVTIPNSVNSIGHEAFSYCRGLTSVTIPNSVISIGNRTFQNCSGLTSILIPNSVNSIGIGAFLDCGGLTDVWCYAESVPSTQNSAFYNSSISSATLHVPAASVEAYSTTEPWSNFGAIVAITDEDAVKEVNALPVLIHTQCGTITIQGAAEGTPIAVYDTSGKQYGSALAHKDCTTILNSLLPGTVAVVKIGEMAIKVTVK